MSLQSLHEGGEGYINVSDAPPFGSVRCIIIGSHLHQPSVAMVQTKDKPILSSGECYMGY